MALCTSGERRTTERFALVECDIISYLCGLADHDAHPMIDEYALPDPRPGVNLDAS